MTPFLSQLAAEEFTRRRAALIEAHARGAIPAQRSNDNARIWLAIAAAAGADPRTLAPEWQDDLTVKSIWPPGRTRPKTAEEIADPAEIRAELTRARDQAAATARADTTNLKAQQRAWDREALASHLGCPELQEA